jgi:hypothetical protein
MERDMFCLVRIAARHDGKELPMAGIELLPTICLLSKDKIFLAKLLLDHTVTCTGCEEEQCAGFKKIIKHTETCQVVGVKCPWCPTMHTFFQSHAKKCTNVQNGWSCSVPFCDRYKAVFAAKAEANPTKRAKGSDEIEG